MHLKKVKILNTFFLFLIVLGCTAQSDSNLTRLRSFVQNINSFNALLPQEKVYLHFDNTSYFLGESIWFKAYVVTPTENLATTMSKVLYVELLNQQGYVLQTRKLKIEDGQCHGDFALSDSLFAGFYEVRAYTRYQLNFHQTNNWDIIWGNYSMNVFFPYNLRWVQRALKRNSGHYYEGDFSFSRVFPVYDMPNLDGDYKDKQVQRRIWTGTSEKNILKTPTFDTLTVSFYPEGGSLVKGSTSRVAFKSVDGEGMDVPIEGFVMDKANQEVASFKTFQRGMGQFYFCPRDTAPYLAKVKYKDKFYQFKLPASEEKGYVMSVNSLKSDTVLMIQIEKSGESNSDLHGISVLSGGKVIWFDTITINKNHIASLLLPRESLPSGVNQLTLFNANGQILADRLIFIQKKEHGRVELKSNWVEHPLKSFECNQINFIATAADGKAVGTTFSVAIRDESTTDGTYYTDNISTNLLLSSELKGYIANPAYFFESDDADHCLALDLLMMTQGWRRYAWKTMAGINRFELIEPVEKGLMVDGVALKWKNLTSKAELSDSLLVRLSMDFTDSLFVSDNQKAAKDGSFSFYLPDFQGKRDAIIELSSNKNEKERKQFNYSFNLMAKINRFPLLAKNRYTYYETNPPLYKSQNLNMSMKMGSMKSGMILPDFEVNAKRKRRVGFPDFSHPDIVISGKESLELFFWRLLLHGEGQSFNEIVNNYNFTSLLFRLIPEAYHLNVEDEKIFIGHLNDSCILNKEVVKNLLVENLESINIYLSAGNREPFRYSHPNAYILLKMKDGATRKYLRNTRPITFQGYSFLSDFYHPDYSKGVPAETKDYRRTLYWNPVVQTDSAGMASVSFYNNATCQKIDISAEGITKDGMPFVYKNDFK